MFAVCYIVFKDVVRSCLLNRMTCRRIKILIKYRVALQSNDIDLFSLVYSGGVG